MQIGYSQNEIAGVPNGANLNLGCGNPQAFADLQPGEVILDLGSGAGFDCFLAAKQVGKPGKVIGIDMTFEMVRKAKKNAISGSYTNTFFHLGQIEHLPIKNSCIDVIISNCVINLSTDKAQVFLEAYRVLKPGGRLAVSDVIALTDLPDEIKNDLELYSACFSGALEQKKLANLLEAVGFSDICFDFDGKGQDITQRWSLKHDPGDYIRSASIKAVKPKR
jgi:SAM-dependent methyltransferase